MAKSVKYSWIGNLLRAGGDAKTSKDQDRYVTGILYLLPHKLGGGANLCAMAEIAGCIDPCLVGAGRGQMSSVQRGRQRKTDWFNNDRASFMAQIVTDLEKFVKYCAKRDVKPAQRLNGTSDILWERIPATRDGVTYPSIMEAFPEVQFYDYTKISNRNVQHIPNYHLTFSYSEANPAYARHVTQARDRGMNIAVVWRSADLIPQTFQGLPVIDGDETDLRFLDHEKSGDQQCIVGLYAKGAAKHDTSGFVLD